MCLGYVTMSKIVYAAAQSKPVSEGAGESVQKSLVDAASDTADPSNTADDVSIL